MSLWSVATYWPVLLVFMRVVALRMLAGRLLPTTGRRWTAVMLVLLVDSLGNDYFSPQSIGYVLAMGVLAFAVNGLRQRPFDDRRTFWLLLLVGVALGPTHELSPYMAAGALLVLALFGQAPFWTCLPVGLPALAWAGLVHKRDRPELQLQSAVQPGEFPAAGHLGHQGSVPTLGRRHPITHASAVAADADRSWARWASSPTFARDGPGVTHSARSSALASSPSTPMATRGSSAPHCLRFPGWRCWQ